jgi:hypothetical protein
MLIVHFHHTFRERFPEWVTSTILLLWGFTLLMNPSVFNAPFYTFLRLLAPVQLWASIAFVMGIIRLISLYINGRKRQTPPMRMLGACSGILIWFGVFVGGMVYARLSPSVALYFGLTVLDAAALYFATVDAKKVSMQKGIGR